MARLHSDACERNRDPILAVLQEVFPREGLALEIAAGTGMHAVHFAPAFPELAWQPTDYADDALVSIEAWRRDAGAPNLRAPLRLDVTADPWPVERADAIFNANMIHISPFACTHGILAGAARVLADGGPLVMYGPYKIGGEHTAPSNARFDESLRARDPSWGVRDLDEVIRLAEAAGLAYERRVSMPANNLCVIYRRRARS
ncbi:MAG: DUF938 domain-containing protein [Sandaracinaceae bacterium]|nr:DUF938 domain-containing protein [Sandaracinaceae bacterium]